MASNYDIDSSEAPINPKEKGKTTKKLYAKDTHSSRISTNKSRWDRLLFLAYQLARDVGVQLIIFGYFPNDMVGSCGSWSFGKITKLLKKKSDTTNYYKYWEKLFSLIEAQRQNKETVDVEKCHEAATFNIGASVNLDSDGASDVENESEDADVEKESEVEALEEIVIPSDEKNSIETLESVEFESVDQLKRWLNAKESSVTETEIILTIDPETSTVSFPPILQNATATAKTPPPPAFKVPRSRLSSVSVTLDDKATGTLSPTPLATKYPATTLLSTVSSSTPDSLGATCVRCSAKILETSPATKDPATTSPPTDSDPVPSVPLDVTYVTLTAKASKTPQTTKDPASTSLPTDSDPALSHPLDVSYVTLAAKASKMPQAAKDQATTSLPTDTNPAPSVLTASAVNRSQPSRSNAKKRTATKVLESTSLPAESSPTPSVLVRLTAKRKQPPRKKAKKNGSGG
ncbi:hypothetical protein GHT06_012601 [Daphnia sinensis]|uniref:Uncharacterized protein n=1 Tax=Daphnia sinensis TaxID=1820382 RepID=A0AAD5LFA2_9CRUS|nr:hypothetical protein GHT06_012601 [Daphnia sinensis]